MNNPAPPIPPWPNEPAEDELGYWTFSGYVSPYVYQSITGEHAPVREAYHRALIAAYQARLSAALATLERIRRAVNFADEGEEFDYVATWAKEALALIGPLPKEN